MGHDATSLVLSTGRYSLMPPECHRVPSPNAFHWCIAHRISENEPACSRPWCGVPVRDTYARGAPLVPAACLRGMVPPDSRHRKRPAGIALRDQASRLPVTCNRIQAEGRVTGRFPRPPGVCSGKRSLLLRTHTENPRWHAGCRRGFGCRRLAMTYFRTTARRHYHRR